MIDNTELEWPFTAQDCSVCGPVEETACSHLTEPIDLKHPNLSCVVDHNLHHEAVQHRLLCLDEDFHKTFDFLLHISIAYYVFWKVS